MHETLRTIWTGVSLHALVSEQVLSETGLGRVHLGAQVANVLLIAKVRRDMNTQRQAIVVSLFANIALKCARIFVLRDVLLQHLSVGISL